MPHLFSPLTLRSLVLRNRVMMSPMCMYSAAEDGLATDWHLAHYRARAVGRVGLLVTEATAVEARGRISANDLGLWEDGLIEPLARVVRLVHAEGAAIGVQLAHAGRKAWSAHKGQGPSPAVAPSPLPFDDGWRLPDELSPAEIDQIVAAWRLATMRAEEAGFDAVEIHAAHGYLNHHTSHPCPMREPTSTGDPWPTGCVFCCASSKRCARPGQRKSRCSCAFRPLTGSRAA